MNNKAAIANAVQCARRSSHIALCYDRAAFPALAAEWRQSRAAHMATARQLKQDAQQ